jgi:hypothetical protein
METAREHFGAKTLITEHVVPEMPKQMPLNSNRAHCQIMYQQWNWRLTNRTSQSHPDQERVFSERRYICNQIRLCVELRSRAAKFRMVLTIELDSYHSPEHDPSLLYGLLTDL